MGEIPRENLGRRKQTGIEVLQFPVPMEKFPVSAKYIPCSVQNRESSATNCNCSANWRHNAVENVETAGNFKNSLLLSLFSGKRSCRPQPEETILHQRRLFGGNLLQ
jgi:hypothetical protein